VKTTTAVLLRLAVQLSQDQECGEHQEEQDKGKQRNFDSGKCDLIRVSLHLSHCAATDFGRLAPGNPGGYGYHWWVVPPLPGGVNNGAFSANGAFGQIIFVNPAEQVVVAIQSAWRQPQDSDAELEVVAMIRAAVRALQTDPAP